MNFPTNDNDMVVTASLTIIVVVTVNHKGSHSRAWKLIRKTEREK
jgi:hypothetical protein